MLATAIAPETPMSATSSSAPGSNVQTLARGHPLLTDLTSAAKDRLLAQSELRRYDVGATALVAGEENTTVFLIVAGSFHAVLDPSRPQSRVPIEAGECFGEMSVIEQKPTSATVIAGPDACALAIPDTVFWATLASDPAVARSLLRTLSERMRRRSEFVIAAAREHLELEAVQRELALAKEVQLSMLPEGDTLLAGHAQVDAAAFFEPAHVVGGDFFDVFLVDANRVFVAVGDVAGKGISAAIFMARCLATLRLEALSRLPYETLLERINVALCEHNPRATFVTLFAGLIDIRRGELAYFCAGHHAAILVRPDGSAVPLPRPPGMVAGALPEADYSVAHHALQAGDLLIAYSDGVTEAENEKREQFGEERVLAALRAARPRTADEALAVLRAALAQFVGSAPPADDTTILALRLLAAPA